MDFEQVVSYLTRAVRRVFGSYNDRLLAQMIPLVDQINALEPQMRKLKDSELAKKTEEFRDRHADGESLDDLLPEAFAVCREASRRAVVSRDPENPVPMRHFDVQLIGGIVLHRGMIAEMVTGEGKTLVATLAAYLNALEGKGVHIVTVNDYLAERDCKWMGPMFELLGMSAGYIHHDQDHDEKQAAYRCDVTWGTNYEFGFDYLRDNMCFSTKRQVMRGQHFAIVDECDSVLIDEARTPLIISGGADEETAKNYELANRVVQGLVKGKHFEVKEKEHLVQLTEEGIVAVEKALEKVLGGQSMYSGKNIDWPHYIDQALAAHHLYKRDQEYVVKDGQIVIVDEFTGRLMHGRTWSDGLHQAVTAKEHLKIKEETRTLATISYQNFFRLYKKLAGMTGTALTEAAEFKQVYNLDVVVIPTNKPLIRTAYPDLVYRTAEEKWEAIVQEIIRTHETGRPVLVGTLSVENNEYLKDILDKELKRRKYFTVDAKVLNAKKHDEEAEIIARAGQLGAITIATNMAGRGTDIVLGSCNWRQVFAHWQQHGLAPADWSVELGFDTETFQSRPERYWFDLWELHQEGEKDVSDEEVHRRVEEFRRDEEFRSRPEREWFELWNLRRDGEKTLPGEEIHRRVETYRAQQIQQRLERYWFQKWRLGQEGETPTPEEIHRRVEAYRCQQMQRRLERYWFQKWGLGAEGEEVSDEEVHRRLLVYWRQKGMAPLTLLKPGAETPMPVDSVADLGGLHVVGTERHEARRIDNQLRGRAGRQGDPGSSRFFLSLEDDLMRIFASDRVSAILGKLGMERGVPIEHPMVTRAIERAQKKVEERNFDIRKNLLEYDEVMNEQRKLIYTQRQEILDIRAEQSQYNRLSEELRMAWRSELGAMSHLLTDFLQNPHMNARDIASLTTRLSDVLVLAENLPKRSLPSARQNQIFARKRDAFLDFFDELASDGKLTTDECNYLRQEWYRALGFIWDALGNVQLTSDQRRIPFKRLQKALGVLRRTSAKELNAEQRRRALCSEIDAIFAFSETKQMVYNLLDDVVEKQILYEAIRIAVRNAINEYLPPNEGPSKWQIEPLCDWVSKKINGQVAPDAVEPEEFRRIHGYLDKYLPLDSGPETWRIHELCSQVNQSCNAGVQPQELEAQDGETPEDHRNRIAGILLDRVAQTKKPLDRRTQIDDALREIKLMAIMDGSAKLQREDLVPLCAKVDAIVGWGLGPDDLAGMTLGEVCDILLPLLTKTRVIEDYKNTVERVLLPAVIRLAWEHGTYRPSEKVIQVVCDAVKRAADADVSPHEIFGKSYSQVRDILVERLATPTPSETIREQMEIWEQDHYVPGLEEIRTLCEALKQEILAKITPNDLMGRHALHVCSILRDRLPPALLNEEIAKQMEKWENGRFIPDQEVIHALCDVVTREAQICITPDELREKPLVHIRAIFREHLPPTLFTGKIRTLLASLLENSGNNTKSLREEDIRALCETVNQEARLTLSPEELQGKPLNQVREIIRDRIPPYLLAGKLHVQIQKLEQVPSEEIQALCAAIQRQVEVGLVPENFAGKDISQIRKTLEDWLVPANTRPRQRIRQGLLQTVESVLEETIPGPGDTQPTREEIIHLTIVADERMDLEIFPEELYGKRRKEIREFVKERALQNKIPIILRNEIQSLILPLVTREVCQEGGYVPTPRENLALCAWILENTGQRIQPDDLNGKTLKEIQQTLVDDVAQINLRRQIRDLVVPRAIMNARDDATCVLDEDKAKGLCALVHDFLDLDVEPSEVCGKSLKSIRGILVEKVLQIRRLDLMRAEVEKSVTQMLKSACDDGTYRPDLSDTDSLDAYRLCVWLRNTTRAEVAPSEFANMSVDELRTFFVERAKKAYEDREIQIGPRSMRATERRFLLAPIDDNWMGHLRAMDHLRSGIGLRGYAQVDPKVEYKREGYAMFEKTIHAIQRDVAEAIFKRIGLTEEEEEQWARERDEKINILLRGVRMRASLISAKKGQRKSIGETIVKRTATVGRNDPCPCGSGKKYKKCCGKMG